jgi:transposase
MVVDNVRFHHAKLLKKWFHKHPKHLSPYLPELNPIERAWWYIRKKIIHAEPKKSLLATVFEFPKAQ